MSGSVPRSRNTLGFLLNTIFPRLGELNVLYAKGAKDKNFGHICPCSIKCLVNIIDSDFDTSFFYFTLIVLR